MKINNYIVTGGAGFIGANFVKILSKSGKYNFGKIIILDDLTYASDMDALNDFLCDDVLFYKGDICNQDLLEDLIEKYDIDIVINFAAESHVDKSIESQREFIHTNILGVQSLISACMNTWKITSKDLDYISYKEGVRFIQISTDEVYGSSSLDDDIYFDEESRLNPSNPYSATKASAEHMINAFISTYKFPAIIIRSTNNYGHGQNSEKLIPKVIESIKADKDIALYGDGNQMRNWLYVEDNCHAILEVANLGRDGEVYNVVGNNFITNNELVNKLIDTHNEFTDKVYKGKVIYIKDRLGHDLCYRVSALKLKEEFGIVASSNLEEELKKLIIDK